MNFSNKYRLVILQSAWNEAVTCLHPQSGQFAIGNIRWNMGADLIEFLNHQLATVQYSELGTSISHEADLLIVSPQALSEQSIQNILAQLKPSPSQTILIVNNLTEHQNRCEGIIIRNGRYQPLEEIHFIGPGMRRLVRTPQDDLRESDYPDRSHTTIKSLGTKLFQQVNKAHILLIGCNEIGNQIAWQLATGLGVRQMTLIDPDLFEQGQQVLSANLNLTGSAITRVNLLAQQLVHFNPDLMIHCVQKPMADELHRLKSRFDLIITSVEYEALGLALTASSLSRKLLIPHMNIINSLPTTNPAACHTQEISLFIPFHGCVSCGNSQTGSQTTPISSANLTYNSKPSKTEHQVGSAMHSAMITASTVLELWLSLLQERLGSFQQFLTWDHSNGLNATGATVELNNTCKICIPDDTIIVEAG